MLTKFTNKLPPPLKTWLRYLAIAGGIMVGAILIYNIFAPFSGINLQMVADKLFHPAKYVTMGLLIISLLTFAKTDQKHQGILLKLSLLPACYGLLDFLFRGNIQDFAWFLWLTWILQALNFFIIFSHHQPIGKTVFFSVVIFFLGLFGTAPLDRLPPQKPSPEKQVSTPAPSPSPLPYLYQEYSQATIAPTTRIYTRIMLINSEQPNTPRLILTFSDHINDRSERFEYEYASKDDPLYSWNQAGTKFALYDGNVIRIYTISPYTKAKASDTIEIQVSEINPEKEVTKLVFAGDNKTLYYDDVFPLPHQLGFATINYLEEYKYQVVIVTPTSKKTFTPIFESDYIFSLFVSPSLNSFCLNSGSSGGKWYHVVSGDKIIKHGDGTCKGWIDNHTVLLDETPWDQPAVESIYNLSTGRYIYQAESK